PLLLGAVLRIRLYVLAEDIPGNGGDHLVGGDAAETADGVAAHGEAALGPQVGVFAVFEGKRVIDAEAEVIRPVDDHVVEGGIEVAGTDIAAAEPRGAVEDLRGRVDLLLTVLADHG